MRKLAVILLLAVLGVVYMYSSSSGVAISRVLHVADPCTDHHHTYTVELNDKLYEIGITFGDKRFWEAIYVANADKIANPDLIYEGQVLHIPNPIYTFEENARDLKSVLKTPFCRGDTLPLAGVDASFLEIYTMDQLEGLASDYESMTARHSVKTEPANADTLDIDTFRRVFNNVVSQENTGETPLASKDTNGFSEQEAAQQQSERQIMMEVDGMVLDETRSKVGRDFYDVFYTNWQQPPDTYNFSIRIAEQPSPSLGTIISVEVNDTETFRMRVQPRYDFIQQAGRYAVRQTYSYLQNNDHQLQIY